MDQSLTDTLRDNRVIIVQDLEPKGTVLDALYEDGILTENDVELVTSAKTRKERVQALLSILPTRGPVAYGSFQKALEVGHYEDLAKLLAPVTYTNAELNDQYISGSCPPCNKFLERLENIKMKENTTLKKLLRWQCCLFLDNIEPKDVIDQLFQDHVINMDDIDKVTSRGTRRERCEVFFEILLDNLDTSVTSALKRSLMKKYSFIADEISKSGKETQVTTKSRDSVQHSGKRVGGIRKFRDETRPKVFIEYSSDENECLREIDERTASTFGESVELISKTSEETKNEIIGTVCRRELEQTTTRAFDARVQSEIKTNMISKSTVTLDEDLEDVRRKRESQQLNSTELDEHFKLSTATSSNTRPKLVLSENSDEGYCRGEIEERNARTLDKTTEVVNKHFETTRLTVNSKEKLQENIRPRKIEERTASKFCETGTDESQPKETVAEKSNARTLVREIGERSIPTVLFSKHSESTRVKEITGEKMFECVWSRELEERTASTFCENSELTFKANHETEPKEILVMKGDENDPVREIEERTASTLCEMTNETLPKEIIPEENERSRVVREIEERSASALDSVFETNVMNENAKMKFLDCTYSNQSNTAAKEKTPLSRDGSHNSDCVDGAISDRRLKVMTLDKSLHPMKSEHTEQVHNNIKDSELCLTCTTSVRDHLHEKEPEHTQSSNCQQEPAIDVKHQSKELLPLSVTATHTEGPKKRLTVAFNYLSTLINQGEFVKFQDLSGRLRKQFPTNYDLMCIIGYLQTSRDLFQTNFDAAKKNIDATMAIVPKTSNPRYFTLELFTAKTRMYITRKKLAKLQNTLDEAMMILETDPVGCTGRAAGWLYINHARNQTAQLSCLNLSKQSALVTYERLFQSAKSSFQRSMSNFKRDGGKDGPFGFGYALCRLVILLLRCGDNGMTMDDLSPPTDDLRSAGHYLQHLEDSDIVISKILDMHFRLAKCDYQFRRHNYIRASEHAQIAYDLATEMNLLEFKEHAHNRLAHLRSKTSAITSANEISGEEAEEILFGDSSDND